MEGLHENLIFAIHMKFKILILIIELSQHCFTHCKGISSHSTLLSGILMFIITYASPMFILLSLVIYISMKNMAHLVILEKADAGDLLMMMLGFPCLVPLVLNSILLTAYTVVLLLMRNHLFVWSVFSPK